MDGFKIHDTLSVPNALKNARQFVGSVRRIQHGDIPTNGFPRSIAINSFSGRIPAHNEAVEGSADHSLRNEVNNHTLKGVATNRINRRHRLFSGNREQWLGIMYAGSPWQVKP